MYDKELIPISEYNKLAVLDLFRIRPKRTEWTGKYWAFFDPTDAQSILDQYEAELLEVNASAFVASIRRVKDRIFEAQRTYRQETRNSNATTAQQPKPMPQ